MDVHFFNIFHENIFNYFFFRHQKKQFQFLVDQVKIQNKSKENKIHLNQFPRIVRNKFKLKKITNLKKLIKQRINNRGKILIALNNSNRICQMICKKMNLIEQIHKANQIQQKNKKKIIKEIKEIRINSWKDKINNLINFILKI